MTREARDTAPPASEAPTVATTLVASTAARAARTELPGARIGPYRLVELIGEGGFGSVFMAEQEQPVARKVALKIIKLGMDTRQVVARFEQERQALAILDHPCIAKVFDAGATEAGRPYFVMELCSGEPIDIYCDRNSLDIPERLELFTQVCQAVQHAHTKGIIHRDIKPSNVLVSAHDGKPLAKVIDFGIAKATASRMTEKTLFTEDKQIIGTPEYMSPEQAEGSLDIDTRTDVYSLGVLLYELLTGTTPFTSKELRSAAYAEIQRIIREVEPARPSTRLSQNSDSLANIAAKRHTEPRRLGAIIRGELDWIVMKALAKDRSRRYGSASELARDVERYLNDDAVEACPPSAGYQVRKFVHRNRRLLATAAAFAATLVLGITVTAWQAVRATHAEIQATQDRDIAILARVEAVTERGKAEQAAAEATSVLKFFADHVLAAPQFVGTANGLGRDVTLRQALDDAEPQIDAAFKDQPRAEASVRIVLGATYFQLGDVPDSLKQAERALALRTQLLGPEHPDTLDAQISLGQACMILDQRSRGAELIENARAARIATLGPNHADCLRADIALATARINQSRWQEAVELLERVTNAPGVDPELALHAKHTLVTAYKGAGRLDRAITTLLEVLPDMEARFGADSYASVMARATLGTLYVAMHEYDRAIPLLEQGMAKLEETTGAGHPALLRYQNELAAAYRDAGQADRALALFENVLAAQVAKLGPDDSDTLATEYNLFNLYQKSGDYAKAEHPLREFTASQKRLKGETHRDIAAWLVMLGDNLSKQQKWTDAEPVLRECLKLREAQIPDDWRYFNTQWRLGASLRHQKKYAEAETLELAGYEGMKQRESTIPPSAKVQIIEALTELAALYRSWDEDEPGTGHDTSAANWKAKLEATKQP